MHGLAHLDRTQTGLIGRERANTQGDGVLERMKHGDAHRERIICACNMFSSVKI